uniref:VWFD domain-containing protein n=1 Tax=Bos indicus x Bos taurus TaxID=30522 RepID=A0A4W2H2W0_BOBOX
MPTGLRLCGRGRHLPTAGPRVPPPSRKLAECCLRSGCPAAVPSGQALCLPRRCPTCPVLSLQGRVCGLCGNFDDNALNDFTTRSQSVASDVLEFGNSWKFSPSCPDALAPRDPCTTNPYRRSWAQKQCSIINSATFSACRSQVDPTRYYEACVSDACACDSGGDCECFCTAVAAYAQACHEAGVCVSWRTPDVCPLFCDYYNPHGQCEWHYQPCGAPCLKTCRNPSGLCLMDLPGLEGEDRLLWGGHTSSPQDSTQARGPGAPAAPCPPLGQGGRDGGAATAHDAWLET